jgi:hypothetical protein
MVGGYLDWPNEVKVASRSAKTLFTADQTIRLAKSLAPNRGIA